MGNGSPEKTSDSRPFCTLAGEPAPSVDLGISMFDGEQRLIVCNRRYREIFSLPEELTVWGTRFSDIVRYHVKRDTGRDDADEIEHQRVWIESHIAEMRREGTFSSTRRLKDGRMILVSNHPLPDGGWVDLQEDITEKCEAEQKITWLARHDTLTEIANRHHFREQLSQLLEGSASGDGLALHLIDLDGFKEVNDTFGHPVGDALLKSVAKRLCGIAREHDVVARLGGDEFGLVQKGARTEEQASRLAVRILRAIAQPHYVLGHTVSVGASIGIALAPTMGRMPMISSGMPTLPSTRPRPRAAAFAATSRRLKVTRAARACHSNRICATLSAKGSSNSTFSQSSRRMRGR